MTKLMVFFRNLANTSNGASFNVVHINHPDSDINWSSTWCHIILPSRMLGLKFLLPESAISHIKIWIMSILLSFASDELNTDYFRKLQLTIFLLSRSPYI
jgi:hypothetical protein